MINQLSFEKTEFFKELHCTPSMNPELEDRIKSADLIIYSPRLSIHLYYQHT